MKAHLLSSSSDTHSLFPKATARLLLLTLRRELRPMIALLEDHPDSQYALLVGLFAVRPTLDDADLVCIKAFECMQTYLGI